MEDYGAGRPLDAHPRRPDGDAQLTYIGSRVNVAPTPTPPGAGTRYASKDGKVVWHSKGDEGQLSFDPLLADPVTCRLKPPGRANEKSSPKK